MIKHIVLWKMKDQAEGLSKEENMKLIKERLSALPPLIPQLKSMQIGFDITHSEMSYDLGLVTEFDSVADMHTYRDHPEHQKVSKYVRKVIESRIVIDFEE